MPAQKRQATDQPGPSSSSPNSKSNSTIPTKKSKSALQQHKIDLKQISETKNFYKNELYQILQKHGASSAKEIPKTEEGEAHTWTNPGLIPENCQKFRYS